MDCFLFARGEPIMASLVSEHLEHRFLVHYFASKRIHEADVMVHVCAEERMRIVIAREEFVNDYSFIDEIDAKRAASKLPLLILKIVRRTDDRGNTVRAEMLLQKNKFTRSRQVVTMT